MLGHLVAAAAPHRQGCCNFPHVLPAAQDEIGSVDKWEDNGQVKTENWFLLDLVQQIIFSLKLIAYRISVT